MCSFLLFAGDFRDLLVKFAIAIYPREGTKTTAKCAKKGVFDCNLSPRGDENKNCLKGKYFQLPLQFIPARGRKPFQALPKKYR